MLSYKQTKLSQVSSTHRSLPDHLVQEATNQGKIHGPRIPVNEHLRVQFKFLDVAGVLSISLSVCILVALNVGVFSPLVHTNVKHSQSVFTKSYPQSNSTNSIAKEVRNTFSSLGFLEHENAA